ncbi:MAG: lipocalin family protein [Methylophilus sp.]|nr:lipocalin family protein [Methylophilus sp.]
MPPPAEQAIIRSFNPDRYLGKWYEIARLDNSFEKGLEQVTAHYSLQEDGTIKVVNRGFNTEEKKSHEAIGIAKFLDGPNADGSRTGKLKVSFFRPFYGEYNILELEQQLRLEKPEEEKRDYQYALVSSGRQYLWILSRTPQLEDKIKQQLISKAKLLGFATDQLLFIRQVNQVEHKPG